MSSGSAEKRLPPSEFTVSVIRLLDSDGHSDFSVPFCFPPAFYPRMRALMSELPDGPVTAGRSLDGMSLVLSFLIGLCVSRYARENKIDFSAVTPDCLGGIIEFSVTRLAVALFPRDNPESARDRVRRWLIRLSEFRNEYGPLFTVRFCQGHPCRAEISNELLKLWFSCREYMIISSSDLTILAGASARDCWVILSDMCRTRSLIVRDHELDPVRTMDESTQELFGTGRNARRKALRELRRLTVRGLWTGCDLAPQCYELIYRRLAMSEAQEKYAAKSERRPGRGRSRPRGMAERADFTPMPRFL